MGFIPTTCRPTLDGVNKAERCDPFTINPPRSDALTHKMVAWVDLSRCA